MDIKNQLKDKYLKDLSSYRQLQHFYKISKPHMGYVIGEAKSLKVLDSGFWNNDALSEQFDVKDYGSSGSKIFDTILGVVKDIGVENTIQKAGEQGVGKLIFYVPSGESDVYADMIFFNKSKNRDLNDVSIELGDSNYHLSVETDSAQLGKQSYEDVISFSVGDFSFFKEHVLNQECTFYFHAQEDENGEAKEFLSITFSFALPLLPIVVVDYLVNGKKWTTHSTQLFESAINKGFLLSQEQSNLDAVNSSIRKTRKIAKWISWIVALLMAGIFSETVEDAGFVSFLLVLLCIGVGLSGKFIGNKIVHDKETMLKVNSSKVSTQMQEIETFLKENYL